MQISAGQFMGGMPLAEQAARHTRGVEQAALIDAAFDLSRSPRQTAALLDGARAAAETPGGGEFLTLLATLLKQGIVGQETLEVRGEPYTSFVDARIAAPPEVARAPQWRVDLRA